MVKSTTIAELAKALVKFHTEIGTVKKDAKNPYFNSKYASLTSVIETIRTPLAKNGLSIAQFPSGEFSLTTILMHISGEWIEETFMMRPADMKAQSMGAAIAYARRQSLGAILELATEDDDGNQASGTYNAPTVPKSAAPQPPLTFTRAMDAIRAGRGMDFLLEAAQSIPNSVKFNDAEKKDLMKAVQEEIEKLDPTIL